MTTTTNTLTSDYIAPIRRAAELARTYCSADAEHEGLGFTGTGLGALVLGHHTAEDDLLDEPPLDFRAGAVEGYTGYHAVPLVALYLTVNNMADPHKFTAATISEWCQAEDRTAEQVADMLATAADAIANGTLLISCNSSLCTATFDWAVPLRHEQTSGKAPEEVLAEHRGGWLVVHDGRAVYPRHNRTHQQVREELLVGATAALFAPATIRSPR